MAGRYLPTETFKQWARDEVSVDDILVTAAIEAAEQDVDIDFGRRFEVASGTASERLYAAESGDTSLFIHDCVSITSITEDGTTVDTDLWQAVPVNQLNDAGETVPYTHVERLEGTWHAERGKATIAVTADWGWEVIPPSIVEVCKIVTTAMLEHRDLRFGLAAIAESGGVSPRDAMFVRRAQERYSRRRLVFAI